MSTLLFGLKRGASPASEPSVRSTITVVDDGAPSAVAEHSPEYNGADDERYAHQSGGLTRHDEAAYQAPSAQYVPVITTANSDFVGAVNRQISTAGTAAARELAGHWGHGTFNFTDATEPAIDHSREFGSDYFVADNRVARVSSQMEPINDGPIDPSLITTSNANARAAVAHTRGELLQQWLDAQRGA